MAHPETYQDPDELGDDEELAVLPDDLVDDDLEIVLDDERPIDEADFESERDDVLPDDL
ncbi:hypothetical protein IWX78_001019 [Mycetocola sp. CAN_C7]|uniref:hypothetical protein n=1 Tax=Mycetocola sp. CAN_C7 TaxID=2787724 RepID=UPI0018C90E07